MTLAGKGFFIWKIADCEQGDPIRIAQTAKEAGLSHVLIKIADGNYAFNLNRQTNADLVPPVVNALRDQNIEVWGWHYVYGYDPIGEARIAIRRVQQFNLDGYVIDAEAEYKEAGRAAVARRFMNELRKGIPSVPVALSSYRFPTFHPQLPWREFLEGCDFNMPQVYWEKAHNPGAQLARCLREFQALTPARPVVPTGATYKWNGWRPTEADLNEFMDAAIANQLPAVNFYSWDHCRKYLPNLWELLSRRCLNTSTAEKPMDVAEQYVLALNNRQIDQVIALYRSDAVQVTAGRTLQGQEDIRVWHKALLEKQYPGARFSLSNASGSGSTRHFTWNIAPTNGSTRIGTDTLGLLDGKIAYHFTSIR